MKAKKLLVAAGVVAVLSPAIAASAMKATGPGFDGELRGRINSALALLGLTPELPAERAPAPEPGPTRLPFTPMPYDRGSALAPLIWPELADVRALMEDLGIDPFGGTIGDGLGGPGVAATSGGSPSSGKEPGTVDGNGTNGLIGGIGGAGGGLGGLAGSGGGSGVGEGSQGLAALDAVEGTPPEVQLDEGPSEAVTVAPVPASLWMMLAGVAGFISIGVLRRRHQG